MKRNEEDRQKAVEYLRSILNCGDTIYTEVLHVSRSGMTKEIKTLIARKNEIINISQAVAKATQNKFSNRKCVRIPGWNMDMGHALVYDLGRVLFPSGNGKYTINRNGDPKPETDGGYCLNQSWL